MVAVKDEEVDVNVDVDVDVGGGMIAFNVRDSLFSRSSQTPTAPAWIAASIDALLQKPSWSSRSIFPAASFRADSGLGVRRRLLMVYLWVSGEARRGLRDIQEAGEQDQDQDASLSGGCSRICLP